MFLGCFFFVFKFLTKNPIKDLTTHVAAYYYAWGGDYSSTLIAEFFFSVSINV